MNSIELTFSKLGFGRVDAYQAVRAAKGDFPWKKFTNKEVQFEIILHFNFFCPFSLGDSA